MKFKDFLNQFLTEGGAAIKGSSKITQLEVRQIKDKLLSKIASVLNVVPSKIKIIGSAGNKLRDDDLSGDIDVAVELAASSVERSLKELAGNDSYRAMKGINVYSFAYPVGNKKVQIDLMPVDDIIFAEWSYQANEKDLARGLKGAHRNELMFAIAKHLSDKVTKRSDDGEAIEKERFFYDLSRGLMIGIQSREGKKGKPVKGFSTISKELVTSDPKKITKIFFGPGVTPNQVSTFEGALKAIMSPSFPHEAQREKILDLAKEGIKKKGLTVPDELKS